ncbi:Aste57867_16972 [Aphanomyces stellatus]|uniref:Aste57867_16972 protein n=1 Tax=Aphanomyces stellatus TaxID=120398 RepID=A0A485L8J8_9STRA|nr:hypothetical protein As57867_016914 [Aphanomyces stellatus]VFT93734.1 Aste57867_16972 [Aphanomyces stellatus]
MTQNSQSSPPVSPPTAAGGLPLGILCLYFVHSFFMTFPMTAYGDWLFNSLHMPPATTSIYYAVSFFPWNLKPVYALLSDNVPIFGYRRKYYIVLCELGAALSVLATGLFVTSSIPAAFGLRIVDSSCEAFSQMMLGIVLVDVAAGDKTKSGVTQAWANAAKNAASILALLVGIPIYHSPSLRSADIIAWSSVIPLVGVAVCLLVLYETKVDVSRPTPPDSTAPRTCRDMVTQKWTALTTASRRIVSEQRAYIPVMAFFFLCSALPGGGSAWYQYTYGLLANEKECFQYMSLAGMAGRIVSCAVYAKLCSGRNVRLVFAVSTVLSMLAGLPQLLLAPPMQPLPLPLCSFMTTESFLTAFTGEFALLQLLVVATSFSPPKKELHGLTYALYLSFMDFGGVVSAFLSAGLIQAVGITEDPDTHNVDWTNLWLLVVVSSLSNVAILGFLFLLPRHVDGFDALPQDDHVEADPLMDPSKPPV